MNCAPQAKHDHVKRKRHLVFMREGNGKSDLAIVVCGLDGNEIEEGEVSEKVPSSSGQKSGETQVRTDSIPGLAEGEAGGSCLRASNKTDCQLHEPWERLGLV